MRRTSLPVILLTALLTIGAAQSPPGAQIRTLRIASFQAGAVRCGAFERVPIRAVSPLPVATTAIATGEPVRFGLRIDQEGRPLGIRQLPGSVDPLLDLRDLAPALTAWRFEPGSATENCEIDFDVRFDRVEEADAELLYRYAALGRLQLGDRGSGALVAAAFARLRPPGSNCVPDPVPSSPLSLAFTVIPEVPGGISYSFYAYDVDAGGRPVHLRLIASSGNRALDIAGDAAIGAARFPPRPRSLCLYYFFRNSTEVVPAPPAPEDFHAGGPACAEAVSRQVSARFRMSFPPEFVRRPAEGWVEFSYDVTALGGLENVRILDSEPAARFGEEVLRAAAEVKVDGVRSPQRGCLQRVRFRLPRR